MTAHRCASVLGAVSNFSLQVMLDRKIITQKQFNFFQNSTDDADFRQIRLYEFVQWWKAVDALSTFSHIPDHWLSSHAQIEGEPWLSLTRAALITISGQIPDPSSPRGQKPKLLKKPLFFRKENPIWTDAALGLTPQSLTWEWSRAGQLEPERIALLARAALLQNVVETFALGGRLEDAHVFVHSVDVGTTQLYLGKYKFSKVDPSSPDTDCILRATLAHLVRVPAFKMELSNPKVAAILEITKGWIDAGQAIDFLVRLRGEMDAYVDVRMDRSDQDHILRISNATNLLCHLTHKIALSLGIAEYAEQIVNRLKTIGTLYQMDWDFPLLESPNLHGMPSLNDSLLITGVRGDLVASDPTYLSSVFYGVLHYLYQKIAVEHRYQIQTGVIPAMPDFEIFLPAGVNLDFTTEDSRVIQGLLALGGKKINVPTGRVNNPGHATLGFSRAQMSSTSTTVIHFGQEEMSKLPPNSIRLNNRWRFFLNRGYWHARHLMRMSLTP